MIADVNNKFMVRNISDLPLRDTIYIKEFLKEKSWRIVDDIMPIC